MYSQKSFHSVKPNLLPTEITNVNAHDLSTKCDLPMKDSTDCLLLKEAKQSGSNSNETLNSYSSLSPFLLDSVTKEHIASLKRYNFNQLKERNLFLFAVGKLYKEDQLHDCISEYFAEVFEENIEEVANFLYNAHIQTRKSEALKSIYRLTSFLLEEAFKKHKRTFGQLEEIEDGCIRNLIKFTENAIDSYHGLLEQSKQLNFNYCFKSTTLKTLVKKKLLKRSETDTYSHEIFKAFSKNHIEFDFFASKFFKVDYHSFLVMLNHNTAFKQKKIEQIHNLNPITKDNTLLGMKKESTTQEFEVFDDLGSRSNDLSSNQVSKRKNERSVIEQLIEVTDNIEFF